MTSVAMEPRLKNLGVKILEQAKTELSEEGYFTAGAFFITEEDEFITVPFKFDSDDDKPTLAGMFRKIASDNKACVFGMLTEAWVALVQQDEFKEGMKASTHPDKKSAAVFMVETALGSWMAMAEIKEENGKKTFDIPEFTLMGDNEGTFCGILPKPKNSEMN